LDFSALAVPDALGTPVGAPERVGSDVRHNAARRTASIRFWISVAYGGLAASVRRPTPGPKVLRRAADPQS
jgi:hypothetical protein